MPSAAPQPNLRELREAAGISLSALARRIGADKGALSKWERGLTDDLDARFVHALSQVLGYTMEQVYLSFRASRKLHIEVQQSTQADATTAAPRAPHRKKLAKAASAVA